VTLDTSRSSGEANRQQVIQRHDPPIEGKALEEETKYRFSNG